jgi:polyhydroxyalkanoate synthesis regulator phasin
MPTKTERDAENEKGRSPFYDISRKLLLAGIGAAVIAQEEIDAFVGRMAEKGELAEKEARQLAKEMRERREKMIHGMRAETQKSRPAAASKADIDALSEKIAELNKKIEELKNTQEK